MEVHLEMYDQLRQEIRAHGKRKSRRYLGSLTVLGVIVGYLFTTPRGGRVLVLVPFVLAFLYLSQISSMNYVAQLAALLALIEANINSPGAEYEFYHGGFNISKSPRFSELGESDDGSGSPETYVGRIRIAIERLILSRKLGSSSDPTALQATIQSRVRDGMHFLAMATYIGCGCLGAYFLSQEGIPEIGISSSSPLTFESSASIAAVWEPITLIYTVILLAQLYILWDITVAWVAYKRHTKILEQTVKQEVRDGNFAHGLRDIDPLFNDD